MKSLSEHRVRSMKNLAKSVEWTGESQMITLKRAYCLLSHFRACFFQKWF